MAVLGFGGRDVAAARLAHSVEVDPRTGAAGLRVPVLAAPGRDGVGPALELAYASGGGNSPFGAGWTLAGLPSITIDTRLHVPRWDGTDHVALAGDELVPWLDATGAPRSFTTGDWQVALLRSRRGSGKTRVERWRHAQTGRIHYRTRDPRGVVTIFGARADASSRIESGRRTFAWLPEVQVDTRGSAMWIEYATETADGVARASFERASPSLTQRYVKRISYGNAAPFGLDDATVAGAAPEIHWCFQLVFDYGDHSTLTPTPDQPWPARVDPFSTYRVGFEVRTYRLCQRILAFHDFAELGTSPSLIGALTLTHASDPAGTTLREIAYTGYRNGAAKSLPPLRMTYALSGTATYFKAAPESAMRGVRSGLADSRVSFIDLFGEGLPGILTETNGAWYYKRNQGGGEFGGATLVQERPDTLPGTFHFGDFDRDGDTDLVRAAGRMAGRFELDRETGRWRPFKPFQGLPQVDAGAPAQWIDLNGDGRPDLIVARADRLVWYASDGDGFAPAVSIGRPWVSPDAPLVTADPTRDFYFADMTGDGMLDLVRARNGRVEYWPNLGNGRFGERVLMAGAPRFAPDFAFDSTRLRFVNIDGSGTADVVYLGQNEVTCWINAGGNRFVPGPKIDHLSTLHDMSSVQVLDFLGDGRASLVLSQGLPGKAPLSYLPLTPAIRPRLLLSVDDSLGRQTQLTYKSSAADYLSDRAVGRPWATKLPMHQTVVERREVVDAIGGTRSVQRYAYHDGYYDGGEREFRGFGCVDVWDADAADGTTPGPGAAAFAAPAMTRTWFHLGARHQPSGVYVGDAALPVLRPHTIDFTPTLGELPDGLRALTGRVLRREMYACDEHGTPTAIPIEVMQSSYRLRRLQGPQPGARAAFSVVELEAVTWTYEGVSADPRVVHAIVVETDDYDVPVREAQIGYARRVGVARDVAAQDKTWIAVADHTVANLDSSDRYEVGVPIEDARAELLGVQPVGAIFTREELRAPAVMAALATPGPSHIDPPTPPTGGGPAARQVTRAERYYWNDDQTAALALGAVGAITLVHHAEAPCFAPDLAASVYGANVDDAKLVALGYVSRDSLWWQAGPMQSYTGPFARPSASTRSDGATIQLTWDTYGLAVVSETDPLGITSTATIDYHLLAPWQIVDGNGTTAEVRYDPLGVIVATSRFGHVGAAAWGFDPLGSPASTPATLADALASPTTLLQGAAEAIWYDLDAWADAATPTVVLRLGREDLTHDPAALTPTGRIVTQIAYLDGLGRVLQEKQLVEPGPAIQRDAGGALVVDAGGRPVLAATDPRWRASGRVVYDAKQQPGRQFEPYFTPAVGYEPDEIGVSTLTRYDAVGRGVGQDFPNGTFARTTYGAWSTVREDPNDTVLESAYRALRIGLPTTDPEREALDEATPHANTPVTTYLDPLGRETGVLIAGGATASDRRTETHLNLEGQAKDVVDPRGLVAFTYRPDMRGMTLFEHSIDAGDTRSLPDAYGRVVTTWDARGFQVDRTYDLADRPLTTQVTGGDGTPPLDARVEELMYGESLPDRPAATAANLLGRIATVRDSAGELTVTACDPAGRALVSSRQLRTDTTTEPDWRVSVPLDADTFITTVAFDALGRARTDTLPDGATHTYEYLPSGPLNRVRVTTPGGALTDVPIVNGAAYGARGERLSQALGNGVALAYTYDPDTQRLARQTASLGARTFQDIQLVYDPVGNIVRISDAAQDGPAGIVTGSSIPAVRDYLYDAHYRLLSATGRVQQALLPNQYTPSGHISLENGAALERFTRTYQYDPSGNLTQIQHTGQTHSWTTNLWVSTTSNRSLPALDGNGNPIVDPESQFDPCGNIRSLSHLRAIEWTWRNSLARAVTIQRPGGTDDDERYIYGADAQRARKLTTRVVQGGQIEVTEKLYLGDAERERITRDGTVILERWTTHVSDGTQRVAIIHRWVQDDLARQVDTVPTVQIRYQLNTHQGSSAVELDATGRVISYEEYFPYGGTAFLAGDDDREVDLKEYRYSGKELDSTGLYYYGYRYLAPWMGRWLSPDPIGPEDDLNLYQFVLGNPIGNMDLDGLDTHRFTVPLPDKTWAKPGGATAEQVKDYFNANFSTAEGVWATAVEQDPDTGQWSITQKTTIAVGAVESMDLSTVGGSIDWKAVARGIENDAGGGSPTQGSAGGEGHTNSDGTDPNSNLTVENFGAPLKSTTPSKAGGAVVASPGAKPSGASTTATGATGSGAGSGTGTGSGSKPSARQPGASAGGKGALGGVLGGTGPATNLLAASGAGRGQPATLVHGTDPSGSDVKSSAPSGTSSLPGGSADGTIPDGALTSKPTHVNGQSGNDASQGGTDNSANGAIDGTSAAGATGNMPDGSADGQPSEGGGPGGGGEGDSSGILARIFGGLSVVAGYIEFAAGAALMFAPVPGSQLLAAFLIWHGTDTATAGARSIVSGKPERTLTSQAIEKVTGVSSTTSDLADAALGTYSTIRATNLVRASGALKPKVLGEGEPASPVGAKRPITAADLGIEGVVEELEGTIELRPDGTVVVKIKIIAGAIRNPFQIMGNLEQLARNMGGTTLRIEANFASQRLRDVLMARYGVTEEGDLDVITRDLTNGRSQ